MSSGGWPDKRPPSRLCRGGCGRASVYTTKELCRRCYRRDKAGLDITQVIQIRRTSVFICERREVDGVSCKHCPACDLWVPVVQFTSTPQSVDGLYTYCKLCAAAKRHGLTREELLGFLAGQEFLCAVCDKDLGEDYVIDHDHRCCAGKLSCGRCVRGILCPGCNLSLGKFGDSSERLLRAAQYLQSYERTLV